MKNKLKPIEVGYGDDKVIFYPASMSVAQENELDQQFNEIADSDIEKYQKEFDICKMALGEFSDQMPVKLVKEKGEFKKVPLNDKQTAVEAIKEFFAERTVENERIIRLAYGMLKSQQNPEVRFL